MPEGDERNRRIMTTLIEEHKVCALCGKAARYTGVMSTNTQSSPDLDTRPSEPARSTIHMWIQGCISCGYCSPDISELIGSAARVVKSSEYKEQFNDPDFPELANNFLCYSIIQAKEKDYADAGLACIHAAWACDDASIEPDDTAAKAAARCRQKAVDLLKTARKMYNGFSSQTGAEEAVLVDLLRCISSLDEAAILCAEGLAQKPEEKIRAILEYQQKLIDSGDTARHTVAEATGESDPRPSLYL